MKNIKNFYVELLNGRNYPKVVEAIVKKRTEIEKTHEVKLNKQKRNKNASRSKNM